MPHGVQLEHAGGGVYSQDSAWLMLATNSSSTKMKLTAGREKIAFLSMARQQRGEEVEEEELLEKDARCNWF